MITYKITETEPNEITDFLGEYGAQRTGTYPGVQVSYYDDKDPDFVVSSQSFYYRPGSAIEKEADLQPFIDETLTSFG